jgi:hypothetical protein
MTSLGIALSARPVGDVALGVLQAPTHHDFLRR